MHAKIKQHQLRHHLALSVGLVVFATALLLLPSIHVDLASARGSAVTRRIDLQWYDLTASAMAWRARLVAAFHVISIDAQIAIYENKYTYLFWRPVTAIRNSGVGPTANWMSFITTPLHPKYPSGHCGYAGAAIQVLTALIGPRPYSQSVFRVRLTLVRLVPIENGRRSRRRTSTAASGGGIHYRFSDEVGVKIGQQVANYDLPRLRLIGL